MALNGSTMVPMCSTLARAPAVSRVAAGVDVDEQDADRVADRRSAPDRRTSWVSALLTALVELRSILVGSRTWVAAA